MGTMEIINEINKLKVADRVAIIKQMIKDLRNEEQLKIAAENLFNDYVSDEELTVFSNLDSEDFYEAR